MLLINMFYKCMKLIVSSLKVKRSAATKVKRSAATKVKRPAATKLLKIVLVILAG